MHSPLRRATNLEFQESDARDAPALVALFRRCYAPTRSIFQPRSRRRWNWKYVANPAGAASLTAHSEGRIAAHVGGLSGWFHFHERRLRVVQAVDHMVDPLWRAGLQAGLLFRRLMGHWVETHCGPHRHVIGWGFPSPIDFRLGARFFGYSDIGKVVILVHDAIYRLRDGGVRSAPCDRFPPADQLEDLWQRSRRALHMGMERNAAWMRWRYVSHPSAAYVPVSLTQADGTLRGFAVMKRGGFAADTATVLEWFVDPEDPDADQELAQLAAERAHRLGCSALAVWLPRWHHSYAQLLHLGFAARCSALTHTARSWDPSITLQDLREQCAWSLGDVDFL